MKGLQLIADHHPRWLPTLDTFRTFVSQTDPRSKPMNLLRNEYRLGESVPSWVGAHLGHAPNTPSVRPIAARHILETENLEKCVRAIEQKTDEKEKDTLETLQ